MSDQLQGEHVFVFVDEVHGGNLLLGNTPPNDSYIGLCGRGTPESSLKGLTVIEPETLQI